MNLIAMMKVISDPCFSFLNSFDVNPLTANFSVTLGVLISG